MLFRSGETHGQLRPAEAVLQKSRKFRLSLLRQIPPGVNLCRPERLQDATAEVDRGGWLIPSPDERAPALPIQSLEDRTRDDEQATTIAPAAPRSAASGPADVAAYLVQQYLVAFPAGLDLFGSGCRDLVAGRSDKPR